MEGRGHGDGEPGKTGRVLIGDMEERTKSGHKNPGIFFKIYKAHKRREKTPEWGRLPLHGLSGRCRKTQTLVYIRDWTGGGAKICTVKILGTEQGVLLKTQ